MKILKIEKNGCTPCKMLGNYLDSEDVEYSVENIDTNPNAIDQYNVMSVPVVVLFDENGSEVDRVVGFHLDKLEEIINLSKA